MVLVLVSMVTPPHAIFIAVATWVASVFWSPPLSWECLTGRKRNKTSSKEMVVVSKLETRWLVPTTGQ